MAKNSLRDRVDGNELDLSLSNLSVVPVKEISALKKANHLDLSCNQLKALNDIFSTSLTHLVKIDLSKNQLTSLPHNFGCLKNLQHLDVLGNQLTTLPVSFCQLIKLKWLDLKDNPIEEPLKSVAGNCLNDAECKKCAQKVVRFLTGVNSQLLKRQEEEDQKQRELEKAQKAEEARERKKRKAEKQAQTEQEKKKKQALKKAEKIQAKTEEEDETTEEDDVKPVKNGVRKHEVVDSSSDNGVLFNCCGMLMALLVLLLAACIGLHYFCLSHSGDKYCKLYYKPAERQVLLHYDSVQKKVLELYQKTLASWK